LAAALPKVDAVGLYRADLAATPGAARLLAQAGFRPAGDFHAWHSKPVVLFVRFVRPAAPPSTPPPSLPRQPAGPPTPRAAAGARRSARCGSRSGRRKGRGELRGPGGRGSGAPATC